MRSITLLLLFVCIFTVSKSFAQISATETQPVWVPDINGLALKLVKPDFPSTAIDVGADGESVTVKVVVDEGGNPVSAQCSLTCHPMLKAAAELAALTSRFKPQTREGQPVRFEGTLLYTYVVSRVDWYRFGTALESTRQFDNISISPVAQILSSDFAAERARLVSLDAEGVDYNARQKGIADVIRAVRLKLKGMDLWRFDTAMALRRITFWSQAGGPIDRLELQKAIGELSAFISAAPENASAGLLTEMIRLSKYKVQAEMPEGELRREVSEMSRRILLVDLKSK